MKESKGKDEYRKGKVKERKEKEGQGRTGKDREGQGRDRRKVRKEMEGR